jgi:hypothetical protein
MTTNQLALANLQLYKIPNTPQKRLPLGLQCVGIFTYLRIHQSFYSIIILQIATQK